MEKILENILFFFSGLDYIYMITLALIAEVLSKDIMVNWLPERVSNILKAVPMIYRVLVIGIVYGGFVYWARDYNGKQGVETIMTSLVFTIVFHKALFNKIFKSIK